MYLTGNTDITRNISLGTDEPDVSPTTLLIQKCIEGNAAAQRELYETYAPFIKGVVIRYIADKETARDLLNDIFCRIFSKLELYSPTGPFEGWMRRIAVNLIIDHSRRNLKFKTTKSTDFSEYDVYVPDDISGKIAFKELVGLIHGLPDTQRTVFNLFVFENLTHKEIASLLDMTENNCRWHLSDARKRLKEKLNGLKP